MDRHDVLQHIPLEDYDECGYEECKEMHFDKFNQFIAEINCDVRHAVNGWYYHGYDTWMDENGMEKFVAMIAGMLFMIEHNDVEADQAYGTNYDINDFETGKYDDLFTENDLKLIKKDIKIIKTYIEKHPELLEE
ncbi:MAG: hypothetical protein U0M60_18265 [Clostridia bacterium]|nr:hypothetical protein [Clostridia bacterium]